MGSGNLPGQAESQTGAVHASAAGLVHPVKTVKNQFLILDGDRLSLIGQGKPNVPAEIFQTEMDRTPCPAVFHHG